jgi:hypothetical protein
MSDRGQSGERPKSAAELMEELQRDPKFAARQEEQEDDRRLHLQDYRVAAHGLLTDLAAIGLKVEAVGDLRQLGKAYPEAVPVLIRWLPNVTNTFVKEDIIRTLSVPWAREAAPILISEFQRADGRNGLGLRWAIGNALEVLATDAIADDMIRLATDRSYGRAREMIVAGLGKLKDSRVVDALISLLTDEDVVGHAVMALGRLRAKAARSRIEPLLSHPKAWIRKEAKKALTRIDK